MTKTLLSSLKISMLNKIYNWLFNNMIGNTILIIFLGLSLLFFVAIISIGIVSLVFSQDSQSALKMLLSGSVGMIGWFITCYILYVQGVNFNEQRRID